MEERIDDQEQYSIRNCVLIHGIPESHGEDTNKLAFEIFRDKLEVEVSQGDRSMTHRIGKAKTHVL